MFKRYIHDSNKITKDYYKVLLQLIEFMLDSVRALIYVRGNKIFKSSVKKYGLKNFAFYYIRFIFLIIVD